METNIQPSKILQDLAVNYTITPFDLANIPSSGSAVIAANHPAGQLDIIVLLDVILKIREDVRFVGSKSKTELCKEYMINIKSANGIAKAREFVSEGGLLIIFGQRPSDKVKLPYIKERRWRKPVIKFIHSFNVAVIPLRLDASFSLMPFEILQAKGRNMRVSVGSAITLKMREGLSYEEFGAFLHTNILCLKREIKRKRRKAKTKTTSKELIENVERKELIEELKTLSSESLLFSNADYQIFFSHPSRITSMMREIGRERERTFREIGEGTMLSIDTDKYDRYYHQLFIWDSANKALVGAYRLGLGDKIMHRHGLKGFYTNSLFRMKKPMREIMNQSIELGRSFIVPEYQKKPASLLMLWKGIMAVAGNNKQYKYMVGPVTISGEFQTISKMLLVEYLKAHHYDKKRAKSIVPLTGLPEMKFKANKTNIKKIKKIELINKIIYDIEKGELTAPVLFRKYMQLGSRVLAFNVDREFCDALDALIMLDCQSIPLKTIEMLTK